MDLWEPNGVNFRLVGTFLDPGYMGLLMAFGGIMSLDKYLMTKKKSGFVKTVFFAVTLLFTYSRASYMAFLFGISYLFFKYKKIKILAKVVILFVGPENLKTVNE